MSEDQSPADEWDEIAGGFTARVDGVRAESWDAPAPVEGWTARDVVRHLVEWFPSFLESGSGVRLEVSTSVDDDPVAAWHELERGVRALLADLTTADRVLSNPHIGDVPLDRAVSQFFTADVFMHTWDLARATGQDETLDAGALRGHAGRHGAARRGAAGQRPVRPQGRGPGRRRRADAAAGLHRTRPLIAEAAEAVGTLRTDRSQESAAMASWMLSVRRADSTCRASTMRAVVGDDARAVAGPEGLDQAARVRDGLLGRGERRVGALDLARVDQRLAVEAHLPSLVALGEEALGSCTSL